VCHVSLPSSYRSRRGHIHLLRVLPLVGCRSKTLTEQPIDGGAAQFLARLAASSPSCPSKEERRSTLLASPPTSHGGGMTRASRGGAGAAFAPLPQRRSPSRPSCLGSPRRRMRRGGGAEGSPGTKARAPTGGVGEGRRHRRRRGEGRRGRRIAGEGTVADLLSSPASRHRAAGEEGRASRQGRSTTNGAGRPPPPAHRRAPPSCPTASAGVSREGAWPGLLRAIACVDLGRVRGGLNRWGRE
jgi:hypothetical protein